MFETSRNARLTSLLRQFPYPRFALDLGCGDCPGLFVYSGSAGDSNVILGVDQDWASLGRARQQYSAAPHLVSADVHFVQADIGHLPFQCQFDLILIRHPDIDQNCLLWKPVIENALKWLTEPGILVITTYGLAEIEDARRWLTESGHTPVPFDERRLIPVGLDGRDRFVLVYRTLSTRLSAAVSPSRAV